MRKKVDSLIILSVTALALLGAVMVLSTTVNSALYSGLYIKHAIALAIGFALMLFFRRFSYKIMHEISPFLYVLSMVMLAGVLFFGVEIHGGRRWFDLGPFYFQPVEFAKLAMIFFLAYILENYGSIAAGALAVAGVVVLVGLQPDAGSAVVFIPLLIVMAVYSRVYTGWLRFVIPFFILTVTVLFLESYMELNSSTLLKLKYLTVPVSATAITYLIYRMSARVSKDIKPAHLLAVLVLLWGSAAAGIFGAGVLRDYQKKRIVSFLSPDLDPLGAGYNVKQSILAVGSGRLMGKGLFGGTQTQLGFLPVRHNDFIFAAVAEETGFVGAAVMIILFWLLMIQAVKVAERSDDCSGRLIAGGIFALILTQFTMNIGVTLGLLPVIGIQLPFVSYGGSGIVIFMVMAGILMNINRRTELIGR